MMGHRGCRLAVTYPEIAEMQTTRSYPRGDQCSRKLIRSGTLMPEIMIPLVGEVKGTEVC